MSIEASIIIPTYNRKNILKRSLGYLFEQTYPAAKYEIIVVDDGSVDGTIEMIKTLRPPCSLRYFRQDNRGPAVARNLGIKNAKGRIIIFLDDDIFATSRLIEEHMSYHSRFSNLFATGHTLLLPELIESSLFLRCARKRHERLPWNSANPVFSEFLIGNSSVKKENFLDIGLLDKALGKYGWEDIEWGYRAHKKGLQLKFNRNAIAYHYKNPTFEESCRLHRLMGKSAVTFYKKHPDLTIALLLGVHPLLVFAKSILYNKPLVKLCQKILPYIQSRKFFPILYFCYSVVLEYYYFIGIKEGLRKKMH